MTSELHTEIIAFLPRLRRFTRALTGSIETGDDLAQETCLRALSRVEQFNPQKRIDGWMFTIAKNLWLDQVRRDSIRDNVIAFDEALREKSNDGRKITEERLTVTEIEQAIDRLPPELRVLVCLVCVDGRTYKETAGIVDIPIGTVMSRLARARRQLYDHFKDALRDRPTQTGSSNG